MVKTEAKTPGQASLVGIHWREFCAGVREGYEASTTEEGTKGDGALVLLLLLVQLVLVFLLVGFLMN